MSKTVMTAAFDPISQAPLLELFSQEGARYPVPKSSHLSNPAGEQLETLNLTRSKDSEYLEAAKRSLPVCSNRG
jgi:hypothetical protein